MSRPSRFNGAQRIAQREGAPASAGSAAMPARTVLGSPLAPVRAVVFDMDGLLLSTEVLALRALREAGLDRGVELPDSFLHLMIGVPVDACHRLLQARYGEAVSGEALFAAGMARLNELIDAGEMRVKPGVPELLDHLDATGLPHAVATSSSRDKAEHHLAAAGIAERFDAIVTRSDVARGKPDPDLFLRAAELLGTAPPQCLALEDSYNGVRAAHAAGMPVVMVPDVLPANDEMRGLAQAIVEDLHAVVAMLREAQAQEQAHPRS